MAAKRTEEEQQYIRDRYDNNTATRTTSWLGSMIALAPTTCWSSPQTMAKSSGITKLRARPPFTTSCYASLILKAPASRAPRSRHLSLLDVTPTSRSRGAVHRRHGRTLACGTRAGDDDARTSFEARPQAFGRPLYGHERWGVLSNTMKYSTVAGREDLYDLSVDPKEQNDLREKRQADIAGLREKLSETVGREVREAFRFASRGARVAPTCDLVADVTLPGGTETAWVERIPPTPPPPRSPATRAAPRSPSPGPPATEADAACGLCRKASSAMPPQPCRSA